MVQTDDKLAAIRRGVPATEKIAFLNAGSHGPLTAVAGEAIKRATDEEVFEGRLGALQFQRGSELKTAIRAQFARILGCDASEVAITASTTAGMDTACWGLNWRPGDEIVTTYLEHMGGLSALYMLETRFGVRLRFAETGASGERLLESIESLLNDSTRAVVLSHVSWSLGIVLPIKEIADLAHRVGALVIVDGAQSGGAIPIDVKELGVDAYAIPGQKWLCGPEGIGALYVAHDRSNEILPSHAHGPTFATSDLAGHYTLRPDAPRFDTPGHPFPPPLAGMKASLKWFLEEVGPEWAYARILDNAARCRELLEAVEGVELVTPPGRHAGLVHFVLRGWDAPAVDAELLRRNVLVRGIPEPAYLRASTSFYNNEDDFQALAEGVKEILRLALHAPD